MNKAGISAKTWELVGTLFDQLAVLPPRERKLDTLGQPQSVRTLLEQMLAAHDTADPQLLDQTVRAVAGRLLAPTETANEPADYLGRTFGAWRALEEIGRGGMAVVLRGERADGRFDKEVAIKLLPHTGAGVEHQRLLEEIRILARLEHPNIARLIDGGIDDDGTPYLVMEYVHGVPITEYCDERKLDVNSRIRLMMQVIEAALFAHRHLVIHCDIKPGNILVTEDGQTKLVDFGIAALTSAGETDDTIPRGLFCSPAYCAPEQLQGAPPDTAQDIFSLGAVLYEMLCGQRIRDNHTVTRLLFVAEAPTGAVNPLTHYAPSADQDLEAICAQALANKPGERYPGVNAMRADLERWLAGKPVEARAGGAFYRTGKWLRRHWAPAAAGMITMSALISGAGIALWQARQAGIQAELAIHESQRATHVRDFLVGLFQQAEPTLPRHALPSTEEILESGVARARSGPEAPALRADMLVTIAKIYRYSARYEQAEMLLAEARDLYSISETTTPEELFEFRFEQAMLANLRHRFAEAEPTLRELVNSPWLQRQPLASRVEKVNALALTLSWQDKYDEAIVVYRRELKILDALSDAAIEERGTVRNNLGAALLDSGRPEEALAKLELALAEKQATFGAQHRRTATTLANLGEAAGQMGDYARAEQLIRRAIEINRAVFTAPHRHLSVNLNKLAIVLIEQHRFDEAREALSEAQALERQIQAPPNSYLAAVLRTLCQVERALGNLEDAERICREALTNAAGAMSEHHSRTARVQRDLAMVLIERGNPAEAEQLLRDSLDTFRLRLGEDHPDTRLGRAVVTETFGAPDSRADK